MTKSPVKIDASIIILDYNAKAYLDKCVQSFIDSDYGPYRVEVIVVDNASTDTSFDDVQKLESNNKNLTLRFLQTGANIGFAAGNNRGVAISDPSSRYVLFINPDTIIEPDTIQGMIGFLDQHPEIAAATCYVKLALTGQLQPECHRGFPTPVNAFWHFFGFGLPKLFPHSAFFNGYFMGHLDYTKVQEIDCCVGAFLMLRRHIGKDIGWWNEKYFMYGEDLDICYQLREHQYKLFYIPYWRITHFQGISSGIKKAKSAASRATKVRSAKATVTAMRTFYEINLLKNYPPVLKPVVMMGISLLEFMRVFKAKYL